MLERETLCFPATKESYPDIIQSVISKAMLLGLTDARLSRLELGLEEAISNIINYAYEVSGNLWLRAEKQNGMFFVDLWDLGVHFNPLRYIEPKPSDLEERRVGGLGLTFMKKIFAHLSYAHESWQGQMANHLRLGFKL